MKLSGTMSSQVRSEDADVWLTTDRLIDSRGGNITDISTQAESTMYPALVNYFKAFESNHIWKVKLVFSVLHASGTIANSLLLVYLVYYRRYRSPIFCVVLSLCISDLVVCISSQMYLSVVPFLLGPPWMCNAAFALLIASFLSSSYHMILFAALRFFQLVYPLASRATITVSLLTKLCLTIWAADTIQGFAVGSFFEASRLKYINHYSTICNATFEKLYFDIWVALTWAIIPFLATAGFHFSKHIILLCKRSDTAAMTSLSDRDHQRRKQTDTRALALILGLYLVSVVPTIVEYLRFSFFIDMRSPVDWRVSRIAECLLFANSAINPWIYMFAAESVRSDIRKMFVPRSK